MKQSTMFQQHAVHRHDGRVTGAIFDVTKPAARKTDPDTSHEAAERVTKSGVRSAQARQVFHLVCAAHRRGMTDATSRELSELPEAEEVGLDRWKIARRLPELEERKLVQRGQKRACRAGEGRAVPWRLGGAG